VYKIKDLRKFFKKSKSKRTNKQENYFWRGSQLQKQLYNVSQNAQNLLGTKEPKLKSLDLIPIWLKIGIFKISVYI